MSVACFKGEWLLWAGLSGVALVVYGTFVTPSALRLLPCTHTTLTACAHRSGAVIGIPIACVALLWIGRKRGTLQNPHVGANITPKAIAANVQRTHEYFHNRIAYGSLYDQVCLRASRAAPALRARARYSRPVSHKVLTPVPRPLQLALPS